MLALNFLIVTLDPEYDTPGVLKKFGERHQLNSTAFTLATGSDKAVSDFASLFNTLGIPSGGVISHNAKSILLGPGLMLIKEYKENEWSPSEVLKDLESFLVKAQKKTS